jgi:PGF-CTERM protein
MPIAAGEVTGERATLQVAPQLRHDGNTAPNVSVRFRAVDAESGLVETTDRVPVGDLETDGERAVPANLTVEREGGYRIEAIVYSGDRRMDTVERRVSGLDALTPGYARSTVRFTDDAALPALSVGVAEARENRTTLEVSPSLVNRGDEPAEGLRIGLTLWQAESNVVAVRTTVDAGAVRPGRTASAATTVSVPTGYDYYVDAVLYRDGVVIDTARGAVNLDPSETVSVDEIRREVAFEAGDVEGGEGAGDRARESRATASGGQPGFGAGVALVALLGAGSVDSATEQSADGGTEDLVRYARYALLAGLALLALLATVRFYFAVSTTIDRWVAREYRWLFQAALNLVVLLVAAIGISWEVRKMAG